MSDQATIPAPLSKKDIIDRLKQGAGEEQLETIPKGTKSKSTHEAKEGDALPKNGASHGRKYHCITERPKPPNLASLEIGMFKEIPRWRKGSVVNWAAYTRGYPKPEDAIYAANQLQAATAQWNSYKFGVTFQWVTKLDDAAFVLAYGGGDLPGTLAAAFFPNNNPINTLNVYADAFTPTNRGSMKEVFLHELGHVIGLRHEHAPTGIPARNIPAEGGSQTIGVRNSRSVMSYEFFPPIVQDSDITGTKEFYNLKNGTKYKGIPIHDYVPDN